LLTDGRPTAGLFVYPILSPEGALSGYFPSSCVSLPGTCWRGIPCSVFSAFASADPTLGGVASKLLAGNPPWTFPKKNTTGTAHPRGGPSRRPPSGSGSPGGRPPGSGPWRSRWTACSALGRRSPGPAPKASAGRALWGGGVVLTRS